MSMEWTELRDAKLTQLAADKLTYNEIAARMGVTKNSVISRARRLNLPVRRPCNVRVGTSARRGPKAQPPAPVEAQPVIAAPRHRAPTPQPRRFTPAGCCWPIGEPHSPEFRFCGASLVGGRGAYCLVHAEMGYVRTPRLRVDAA